MSITVKGKNCPEAAKLLSHICTYLFEQANGELRDAKKSDLDKFEDLKKVLTKMMK